MFLRANWRAAGLSNQGERFQGTYVAAMSKDQIVAVAAHYGNGMVVVQAPVHLAAVVQGAVTQSGKAISGIAGPVTQVACKELTLK